MITDPVTGDIAALCPSCGAGLIVVRSDHDITLMPDPPAQPERFIRFVRWQCRAVEAHHGTESYPWDPGPPPVSEEFRKGARRFVDENGELFRRLAQ